MTPRRPRVVHLQRLQMAIGSLPVASGADDGRTASVRGDTTRELEMLNAAAGGGGGGLGGEQKEEGALLPKLDQEGRAGGGGRTGVFSAVLRSKGFVWLCSSSLHCQRCYWSHAGITLLCSPPTTPTPTTSLFFSRSHYCPTSPLLRHN